MKVLVTGGAGFIGFHVAKRLIERGDEVIILDNFNDYYDPSLKEARVKLLQAEVFRIDIADYNDVEPIFKQHKIDKVCHLGAQAGVRYSLKNPFIYEKTNGLGTLNLLELCRKYDVKDFIFASSSSVYGGNKIVPFSENQSVDQPVSLYAATKRYNELQAHAYHELYGLNCTGLRFFTVYGPWGRPDMALFLFTKGILEGTPIKVLNNGKLQRDFTFITDIVDGVIAALDKAYPFQIFNLARGQQVELMEFIKIIEEVVGKKAVMNLLPMHPGDVHQTFGDTKKAERMLGYKPKVSIREGVKAFVEWYKEYYNA